jgi:hypothetical protein
LNSIPEVLATIAEISYDMEWYGQVGTQLSLEEALEKSGLKRVGERRDQRGGGARTYYAWLVSLGLIFIQESTKKVKLTLAGEAILAGESPVEIITNQVLKYQFPSSFSLTRGVDVSKRFRIQPFRFILRLLADDRVGYLTIEEIAKIVIVEAENDRCYEKIVSRIYEFRNIGNRCLSADFFDVIAPKTGEVNPDHPFRHILDAANTIANWIEYTQLAKRDDEKKLRILDEKFNDVFKILNVESKLIDRPEEHEYYQRKYGLDPKHKKDIRNLTETKTITPGIIAIQKIKTAFISESLKYPITKISSELVKKISNITGFEEKIVEETLINLYPNGAIGSFMTEYFELAFKGRDNAIEFEKATVELFKNILGFDARHIGPVGLNPDVFLISNEGKYIGIVDNKAYRKYTVSNDHRNRMVHNYIEQYKSGIYPLAFFSYISGGFGSNIDSQIRSIADETKTNGSAISVTNMIRLVEKHTHKQYSHSNIKDIFSVNRQVILSDL